MKLWLILPRNSKDVGWDCAAGFVIRANTSKQAREFAAQMHGDEGEHFWMNSKKSRVRELKPEGKPGPILRDFREA